MSFYDLQRYRPKEYDLEDGPWDPISGGASALLGTLASLVIGAAAVPTEIIRALKVKATDERGSHESQECSSAAELTAKHQIPKTFATVPSAHALSSSQARQLIPSSATRSSSREVLNNSTDNGKKSSDLELKGKRRTQSKRRWFQRHRKSSTQPSSEFAGPELESCFIAASEPSTCPFSEPGPPNQNENTETLSTSHKECQFASKFALEKVTGRRNSAGQVIVSSLKFPMDFALHVAKGFHNAPRLYGDKTVRPLRKIDGFATGIEASGRVKLHFGMYSVAS